MRTELGKTNTTVIMNIYSKCKYTKNKEACENKRVMYENVVAFEVVTGEEATKIEEETDNSCIDDYHEYLVLYLENGETATFRNSYVDLFIW